MCHTDLLFRELPPEFFTGPQVYGHEGSGVVEAVGANVTHVAAGDNVVLSFNTCGSCKGCSTDRGPAYCFNFSQHCPLFSEIYLCLFFAFLSSDNVAVLVIELKTMSLTVFGQHAN